MSDNEDNIFDDDNSVDLEQVGEEGSDIIKKKTNKIIGVIVGKAIYDKSIDLKELSNL